MSDNLEIVMDIDTLEIFDVIDLDNTSEVEEQVDRNNIKEIKVVMSTTHSTIHFTQLELLNVVSSYQRYFYQMFEDSS